MTDKADDYARRDGLCKMCNYVGPKVTELISTYCVHVFCATSVTAELIGVFDTTLETREGRENEIE